MIVKNRYSGEVFHELTETGTSEVRDVLRKGYHSSKEMREIPKFRVSLSLYSISEGIRKKAEDLARDISSETGKPLREARVEVDKSSQAFVSAAEEMKYLEGTSHNGGTQKPLNDLIAFSSNVPLGLILSLGPFTEPLYSLSSRAAAALATGNSVLLKPSSLAPVSSMNLIEIINQAELPADSVQAVLTERNSKVTGQLMNSELLGLVTFSGRSQNAPAVMKKAGLKRLIMETGTGSPVIVWDDADLDSAAESIVKSAFGFQGQSPVRAQNILIKRESFEYFRNRLIELSQQLKPGNPLDEATDYGPLIQESAAIEVENEVNTARNNAAYVAFGGNRDGAFFEPTILENVDFQSELVTNQVLAPVLTIHEVGSFKDAILASNQFGPSNQAGIFTSDINLVMTALDKMNTSAISVNDAPGLPTEYLGSSGPRGNLTATKSLRYLMQNMVEERLAILRR